ncbi:unnamed protein product [Rotaria sp. Silwood2]|nr:unnamed protein product [Rotaria sp. Silwood2]CAF3144226.1 unnamed protein product [Rotaria sp. Silwood2]CAF3579814.1 unnamed protein product [Rotaria sp. Silwood2]CAF4481054.1 unnamed protein product [Rotaria sp. Silwood2]CAF4497852.1 unnamed protein product [Rotaria sp. Silwood2]
MEEDEDDSDDDATSSIEEEGPEQGSQEIQHGDTSIRMEQLEHSNINSSSQPAMPNDANLLLDGADEFEPMIDEDQQQHNHQQP